MSRDGAHVFVSDEYGPYVYEFNRETGKRTRSFTLPDNLIINVLSSRKAVENGKDGNGNLNNPVGRVTNKGMEGLAVTPNGKLLVGIMQANLEQDDTGNLRIVTIDTRTGETHEYAYLLTDGSGVSEILAVNDHQFLVDERDSKGMADTPLLTRQGLRRQSQEAVPNRSRRRPGHDLAEWQPLLLCRSQDKDPVPPNNCSATCRWSCAPCAITS